MHCQALDQLAGSLCCIYRNAPLVSKLAGAAVISYVNRVTQRYDMVLKLRVGCNVLLPLWWKSQYVRHVALWRKAQLKGAILLRNSVEDVLRASVQQLLREVLGPSMAKNIYVTSKKIQTSAW